MTPEQLETIVAALAVKEELPVNMAALIRGLPQHHDHPMTPREGADFILRQWQTGDSETQILNERPAGDKLRDDYP